MKNIFVLIMLFNSLPVWSQDSLLADNYNRPLRFANNLSWQEILSKAKSEGKYVFVDCYTTWCTPCKMMDKDVYSSIHVGSEMNSAFISIQVQMDTALNDDVQTKKWYPFANKLKKVYQVEGFPTYLFFSPEGQLVHKDGGYKSVDDFIRLVKLARDPQKVLFYSLLDNYKQGVKAYETMPGLAQFTKNLIGDTALANVIAKDCKENYLDKLDRDHLLKKENLTFINDFPLLMHPSDSFFYMCYNMPNIVDSIIGWPGWAKILAYGAVTRMEIESKVIKGGKAMVKYPSWESLELNIAQKYSLIDARFLVLSYKVHYYQNVLLDWKLWAEYKDQMIKLYTPKPPYGLSVYIEINGWGGAWLAFMKCNDRKVLAKALEWAELAIKLDGAKPAYLDTKANLLYKLGRTKEAIMCQEIATRCAKEGNYSSNSVQEYQKVIDLMKKGEPTYLHEGAVWAANTTPKTRGR